LEDPKDGIVDETKDDGKPTISIWDKDDKVHFIIRNPSMIETEEGHLVPGLSVSVHSAIEIANAFLNRALRSLEKQNGENQ
jgi:hypothetical protein